MMVHGMCCTGEVWSRFRDHFEARGARVYTPTLRPEQRTRRPPAELRKVSFDDYVSDLGQEAERIADEVGERPVVIGHSMGGLLAQVMAERGWVQAGVFISPSAPAGVRTLSARVMWGAVLFGSRFGAVPSTILPNRRTTSRVVFNRVPADEREAAHAGMVHESGRAFVDLGRYAVDERQVRVPVLTVAATADRLVPAPLVRLTAKKYEPVGGEFREYAEHGHWLYAEPGWERPADEIFDWLHQRVGIAG